MNSITPKARHHQQSQVTQQQKNTSRQSRQLDSSKKRQTNNSNNNKTLLQIDNYPVPNKKKQKSSNNDSNMDENVNVNVNHNWKMVVKPYIADGAKKSGGITTMLNPANAAEVLKTSQVNSVKMIEKTDSEEVSKNTLDSQVFTDNNENKIKIIKKTVLGMGHLSILHAFVRDDLFRDIKILSSNHLETNGNIMKKCLQKLNVTNDIQHDNYIAFIGDIRTEIRKTMCSRRGYVKRQIGIVLTECLKNNTFEMFDITLMKHFYDPKYEEDESVLEAWYYYVIKFLPLVNKQWRDSVGIDKLVNMQSMFHSITISDEALVRWFIQLWMPIVMKNKMEGWKDQGKSTGKGPHDTKANIKYYTLLHHEISNSRKQYDVAVQWNKLFWNEVQKRNNLLQPKKKYTKYIYKNNTDDNILPLPDLNENQEFLATYSNEANSLMNDIEAEAKENYEEV